MPGCVSLHFLFIWPYLSAPVQLSAHYCNHTAIEMGSTSVASHEASTTAQLALSYMWMNLKQCYLLFWRAFSVVARRPWSRTMVTARTGKTTQTYQSL